MNPNIINPHKYKKITRNDKVKKDNRSKKNIKKEKYTKNTYNYSNISSNIKINKGNKNSNELFNNLLKITGCIIAIGAIGFASKYFIKLENNPILSVFQNNKEVKLVANYDFKIGINNLDYNNNVLINELYKYSYRTLIRVDETYKITYSIANKITKIDEKTYDIEIKDVGDVTDVVYSINKLKSSNDNIYYKALSNIASINVKDNSIVEIILTNPDPYIVYSLDFKIEKKDSNSEKQNDNTNRYNFSNDSNNIKFTRNDAVSRNILKSILFTNYTDGDVLVSDFRNDTIDMFLTSSEEDMRIIGKHEYNVKKYRNGETYFLFGNKNSKVFSLKEVRKAIAYSINRNEILNKISSTFSEVIDLPYIYSVVGYKYDIYGAENSLIAESWNKSGGIYKKSINNQVVNLELSLLVNSADTVKINIAESIKQMLESVGIRINIQKLTNDEITQKVKNGEYDLVLASVNINNNPNITYLNDYININENVNQAIIAVNNSSVDQLSTNIANLQSILSSEVACIGIAAKNTNVVYQKYITGINTTSYMNIFKDIDNIGKIVQ